MNLGKRIRRSLIWTRHRLRYQRLLREHPLKYLFLEVTRRCNLACRYCGSGCDPRDREGELTSAELIEVMKQVAEDFEARSIMVAVTGGEPLLKDGILDLFSALRRLRFPYGMVSNGKLLDAAMARRLVEVGIGSISISMDAPPEVNDQLRGKGTSQGAIDAVRHLQEAGYKGKLEIISTVCKPAVPYLDEMRRFVASLQVPLWRVAPVMPIGRAAAHPELVPSAIETRAILEFVREARLDSFVPKPEFSEEGFLGNRFEGFVRPYLAQCRAGITIAGIRANGRIGACPELNEAFDQGNIRQHRLKTVWENGYQVFRDRSWTKKGPCAECGQYKHCHGGALHLYEGTSAEFLRCLYLMCKATDGCPIPRPSPPSQAARTPEAVAPPAGESGAP